MKYTFKLQANAEMTPAEQEFEAGLLQAFELSSTTWTRIEDGDEIPEVLICVGNTAVPRVTQFSMFQVLWKDAKANPPVDRFRNYTAGSFGQSDFFYDTKTYYYKHENDIIKACEEIPNSKGFFPSLKRLYSTDTANQFGYAVGCALNDLMFVESIHEDKEEHV